MNAQRQTSQRQMSQLRSLPGERSRIYPRRVDQASAADSMASQPGAARQPGQEGVALVLTLIFSILLYILVAELVVSGRMIRATGENDALLARMNTQMAYALLQTTDELLADLAGEGEGGEGGAAGGLGGLGAALGGAAGGAGGEGEPEPDPAASCDSSRDEWFDPVGKPDNDITVYVFVEDENRKFNLLSLWSPDEKFAEFSRDRLVRLIDNLREDSEFDVTTSDAETIARDILEWGTRSDLESMPRPKLKSEDPNRPDLSLPLHLDELLLLPNITEDLFYDKVLDGRVYLGLESVLTIWTSLVADPGDPQKVASQQAAAGGAAAAPGAVGGEGAGAPGGNNPPPPGGSEEPAQPMGEGIRVNINTAPRPVLRALFPTDKLPDRVIDAIIKYRNEIDEEAMGDGNPADTSGFGDIRLGDTVKRKIFATTADLENVQEFKDLPDAEFKADFQRAITTKSDVFSIHLAALYKRNEQNRVYVLRRARSIVQRYGEGSDGRIRKLVPWEERKGLRLQPIDLQENRPDLSPLYNELDRFAQEDRAWNPFLIDFYMPPNLRDEFYRR